MNGRTEASQMAVEHDSKQPVAWAIVGPDGIVLDSHIYHTASIAKRWAEQKGDQVLPLYRKPQSILTDAEHEAVRFCSELCRMGDREDLASVLRGLIAKCDNGNEHRDEVK